LAERAASSPLPASFSEALPPFSSLPVPRPLQPPAAKTAHLWCFHLPEIDALQLDLTLLSNDERARHDKMRALRPRQQFAACRIALRRLLASYLGGSPRDFEIACTPGEKPQLPDPAPLSFSYSHTENCAALAFVARGEVGVDLEVLDRSRDFAGIAQRYFHPEEQRYCSLSGSPGTELERFFRVWTAKEALLKASGEGLRGLERASLYNLGDGGLCLHAWRLLGGDGIVTLAVSGGHEIRTFYMDMVGAGDFLGSAVS